MNPTNEKKLAIESVDFQNPNKYRVLKADDREELLQIHEEMKRSDDHQKFHIQPLSGLLNDPNGFSYLDGTWHLFYQWFPYDSIHGMKHWYHVSSNDLCTWKNEGVALKPDTMYDNHGVYSGSAMAIDSNLLLFYTGNHRDENFKRKPYQCLALMNSKQEVTKYAEPLILPSCDYTEHQRDPKILYDEKTQNFYILIGAQNKELKGRILVYSLSKESEHKELYARLCEDWEFRGELKVKGYEDFGYMWECPDLIRFEEKDMLVFCPQGLEAHGDRFQNIYQNGYLLGEMDFASLEFKVHTDFQEIDLGFDFYACQSCNSLQLQSTDILKSENHNAKNLSIGWLGLPDSNYPSDSQKWSGCMSLVRELELKAGKLYQKPPVSLQKLRNERIHLESSKHHLFEARPMEIELKDLNNRAIQMKIFKKNTQNNDDSGFEIMYDSDSGYFKIDRGHMDHVFHEQYGTRRQFFLPSGLESLQIFVDSSSIELFVNEGEFTLSSRVFPTKEENRIQIQSEFDIALDVWELSAISKEEFKL